MYYMVKELAENGPTLLGGKNLRTEEIIHPLDAFIGFD